MKYAYHVCRLYSFLHHFSLFYFCPSHQPFIFFIFINTHFTKFIFYHFWELSFWGFQTWYMFLMLTTFKQTSTRKVERLEPQMFFSLRFSGRKMYLCVSSFYVQRGKKYEDKYFIFVFVSVKVPVIHINYVKMVNACGLLL